MTDLARRVRAEALRAYEALGPAGVTARKLAAATGVVPMAMYRHYRDKDELLDAVAESGFLLLASRLAGADRSRDPVRRLIRRAMLGLEFALEHPRLFELMFILPRARARKYPTDRYGKGSPTAPLFHQDVRSAIAVGRFARGSAAEIALAIWGEGHGLIALYLTGRLDLSLERFRRVYRRSIKRLVAGLAAERAP